MSELGRRLEAAAHQLHPAATPPFEAVAARARARRRRSAVTSAGVGGALLAMVCAVLLSVPSGARDELDATQPAPPADGPPPGSSPEPTPYAVPTLPPEHESPNPFLGDIASGGRSVPWRLTRLWDGGRRLEVEHEVACGGRADVRVRESDDWVLIQALGYAADRACAAGPRRVQVALSAPLAERPLLHAATGELGDAEDTRTLAERWTDAPAWPGEPWYRDGEPASSDELVLSEGAEHCDWESAAFLAGRELGAGDTLYWRDPLGALEHDPTLKRDFQPRATLPADATWTGWTQRGAELWTAPSTAGRYVYLVRAADRSDVERWVAGAGGCA